MLANLGTLLKSQFRLTDVVTRFGGEEFVVLMPYADLALATSKAGQIMEPLENAVTASFGVAEWSGEDEPKSFLACIVKALYQAKADGRNRVVVAASAPIN